MAWEAQTAAAAVLISAAADLLSRCCWTLLLLLLLLPLQYLKQQVRLGPSPAALLWLLLLLACGLLMQA
jgi:hypothetical protein